jgi:hypothetical protein
MTICKAIISGRKKVHIVHYGEHYGYLLSSGTTLGVPLHNRGNPT